MTLEEVIKSGEELYKTIKPINVYIDGFTLVVFTFLSVLAAMYSIGWFIKTLKAQNKDKIPLSLLAIIVSFLMVFIFGVTYKKHREYSKEVTKDWVEIYEEWQEEVAYPYIKSQEYTKKEIRELQLEPTDPKNTNQEGMTLTLLLLDPETNKLTTETDFYQVELILNTGDQPYLTYYTLTEDIREFMQKGRYFKTVYLPKDYQFTK